MKQPESGVHEFSTGSHLTTLVNRFLRAISQIKSWNMLDDLKGEIELRQHVSNIIEFTFFVHLNEITEKEVENLVQILENGGSQHEEF